MSTNDGDFSPDAATVSSDALTGASDNPPVIVPTDAEPEQGKASTDNGDFVWSAAVPAATVKAITGSHTGIILTQSAGFEAVEALVIAEARLHGEEAFYAMAAEPGSKQNLLLSMLLGFSDEAERVRIASAAVQKAIPDDEARARDFGPILHDPITKQQILGAGPRKAVADKSGAYVSGNDGVMAFRQRLKGGIRQVPCWGTGLSIDLRDPVNEELHAAITTAQASMQNYGRQFGAVFFSYSDFFIREAMFDLVMDCIVGSNQKQWNHNDNLKNTLRLNDFNAILMNMAALMWPNGYGDFKHQCTRPVDAEHPHGCGHSINIKIAPQKLIHNDFTRVSKEARALMLAKCAPKQAVTDADLRAYQEALGFDGEKFEFKHESQHYVFYLQVPTMAQYFAAGGQFVNELLDMFHDTNIRGIKDAIYFRMSRSLIPYIQRVTLLNPDGSEELNTTDQVVIRAMLQHIDTIDTEKFVAEKIEEYAGRTHITHVCYPSIPCEVCGYIPGDSGYVAVDPVSTFFTLAYQRLMRR